MDLAGNPYGTYTQEEGCIYCNEKLVRPNQTNISSKILAKIAVKIDSFCKPFKSPTPNWIHVNFAK
jgi:hypothetical protein